MMKRFFALLLCFVMCLSLIPASAFADGEIVIAQEAVNVKDGAAERFIRDPAGGKEQTISSPLELGGLYRLKVPAGGFRYYSFTAPVSDIYYFVSSCGQNDPDPVGYIYASSWALLTGEDDSEGMGKNFRVGHYLNAGDTFYLCLGLYDQSKSGTVPAKIEKDKTGWCREGDDWYFFDEDSRPASGAYYINGKTYGFYEDGCMAVNDAVYDDEEERWYFAGANGEIDATTGWHKGYDGKWYYVVSGGRLLFEEWQQDKGVWYYFVPEMARDGAYMEQYGEHEFRYPFFKANGAWDNKPGWKQDSAGSWYYVNSSGYCTRADWVKIGGSWYYFGSDAKMVRGWRQIGGKWYYFTASGTMKTGWQKYGGNWYYLTSSGAMATGWQRIGDSWYYFSSSGAMATGWEKIGGSWYYFSSSGAMVTRWQKIGDRWYYFGSSGAMATGWEKIGDSWYYFGSSGAMTTGWRQIGGKWYYFTSSGAMKTGWLQYGSKWYYLDSSGAMLANTSRTIGGKTYHFDSSGACTNP